MLRGEYMNQKIMELNDSILKSLLPIHNEINEVLDKVGGVGVLGNISKKQLKQLLETTKDIVNEQITWYRNDEEQYGIAHEDSIYALIEYEKVLESGILLMQEID